MLIQQAQNALRTRISCRPVLGKNFIGKSNKGTPSGRAGIEANDSARVAITGLREPPIHKTHGNRRGKRGDFEAAELYENYMCPPCHVTAQYGHTPSDKEFRVEA
jgi:hypothetical protein